MVEKLRSALPLHMDDIGMTPTDLMLLEEEQALLTCFPRGVVGVALRERSRALWRACGPDERERVAETIKHAAAMTEHLLREGAMYADGDMEAYFALAKMPFEVIERLRADLVASWAALPQLSDEEQWALDDEADRIDEIENDGGYGRTLAHVPESDRWIFVRFGPLPRNGLSRFGLAGEDTEDVPDPWRVELGNMTHESGMCVFRAMRHHSEPGGLVLLEPAFHLARYGVSSWERYLASVCHIPHDGEEHLVWVVRGELRTIGASDGTLRNDLGSDGEYLVKPGTWTAERIDVSRIWISETIRFEDRFAQGREEVRRTAP